MSLKIKEFLDYKSEKYNNPSFIQEDPIQIPHLFQKKEDIEISGFLTATIAWGNRKSIIKSSKKIVEFFGYKPYDFIMNHNDSDLKKLESFKHRTFNGYDLIQFVKSIKNIYSNHDGLETVFAKNILKERMHNSIHEFKKKFFEIDHLKRTKKHISDPFKGSAAKRINMFLRWMVRDDNKGVDFGIWKKIKPKYLSCPLDIHSGRIARKMGILKRKQNDHKAVIELDSFLRTLDVNDPVKYDYALFGIGVFEKLDFKL